MNDAQPAPVNRIRGCLELSGLTSDAIKRLSMELLAEPAATSSSFGGGKPFSLLGVRGDAVLVPRYSKAAAARVTKETRRGDYVVGKSTGLRWSSERELRTDQRSGVGEAEACLWRRGGCIVLGKTGSGKTVVGLYLLYRMQPRRVRVLVDQLNLVQQWAERVREYLPNAALRFEIPSSTARALQKQFPDPPDVCGTTIVLGTVQSLAARDEAEPEHCDMLICDEVHVFSAPTFSKALQQLDYGYALGLTATDDRRDKLDWVFRAYLGIDSVTFAGEVMNPRVVRLKAPQEMPPMEAFKTAWCRRLRKQTCAAACVACSHFADFPNCGGHLPTDPDTNKIDWSGPIARAAMLRTYALSPEYLRWLHDVVVVPLAERGRQVFIFGELREFLVQMHALGLAAFGAERVGLYIGTEGKKQEGHAGALSKQLTYASYGVARKALDVKQKDAAVFGTFISDGRQAVGRIRRTSPGKKTPVLVVPLPNLGVAHYAWRKLSIQFASEQLEVTTSWPLQDL